MPSCAPCPYLSSRYLCRVYRAGTPLALPACLPACFCNNTRRRETVDGAPTKCSSTFRDRSPERLSTRRILRRAAAAAAATAFARPKKPVALFRRVTSRRKHHPGTVECIAPEDLSFAWRVIRRQGGKEGSSTTRRFRVDLSEEEEARLASGVIVHACESAAKSGLKREIDSESGSLMSVGSFE